MASDKRPVYWLKVTDKTNTKHRTNAGAAWVNEYNQLRIVLNPGVVLNWNDNLFLTLEPIDPENPPRLPAVLRFDPPPGEGSSGSGSKGGDDDIPF